MNRRDFFGQVWVNNIKPIVAIAIIVCIAAILLSFDLGRLASFDINWKEIGRFFIAGFMNNWQIIVMVLSAFLAFTLLKKNIPSRHHEKLKKITTILGHVLLFGIIIWFEYRFYQNGQYGKMIGFAVVLAISELLRYLRREERTPDTQES